MAHTTTARMAARLVSAGLPRRALSSSGSARAALRRAFSSCAIACPLPVGELLPGAEGWPWRGGRTRRANVSDAGARPESALRVEPREGGGAGVAGRVTEQFLDAQQLVVLGHPVTTGRGAGLDLTAVGRDGQV